MAEFKPTSWLLSSLKFLAFCVLFIMGVAVIIVGTRSFRQQVESAEYQSFLSELHSDPVAARLRNESKERCVPRGREFYWLCGVVLEAAPTLPYGYCSTPERPLYYGSLDTASQTNVDANLMFGHAIRVSDVAVRPASSDTPYAYPNVFAPEEVGDFEPEPKEGVRRFDYNWVKFKDIPILISPRNSDWTLTEEERAKLPLGIVFKHPKFPLLLTASIPRDEIADWREAVDSSISKVSAAVISFDARKSCMQPPAGVRFSYNFIDNRKLDALRYWVKQHHIP